MLAKNKVKDVFEELERAINASEDLDEYVKQKRLKNLLQLKSQKLNILITGATESGKSSTINALFGTEVARVGVGDDPETMNIEKYELGNYITLWECPGLGDGVDADTRHSENIKNLLRKSGDDQKALIDLVLVIVDASSRDLGTSCELINNVIIPTLAEKDRQKRIIVALNQVDLAMKGRNWDYDEPNKELLYFLEDKVESLQARIEEATGVKIEPIYYSAGWIEEGEVQKKPYNLSKLLYYVLKKIPEEKRILYAPFGEILHDDYRLWDKTHRRAETIEDVEELMIRSISSWVC